MYFLYNVLLGLGFVILLPKFLLDAWRHGKYVTGLRERLGFVEKINSKESSRFVAALRLSRRDAGSPTTC